MNPIIRSLYDRKSVRVYTGRPIPEPDVQTILGAAAQAPTAGNQQLYTILRVTDPDKKHRLALSCDHQPFIEQADLVLIFCADCLRWYSAYLEAGAAPRGPGVGDLMLAVVDAVIAAQNAVVAAQALGVGSCYIGDIMENVETHREILGLPDYVFPAAMLVFGYPTDGQKRRPKPPRFDLARLVCENTYRVPDPAELRDTFAPKTAGKSYEEWMRAFCLRKYNSDFAREMTRSVGEYLRQYET
ncbi:MAG: nitroreductase family protein [Clostridia bacterium]|nr:nitroreductase family protein [Clostridia bacterium]